MTVLGARFKMLKDLFWEKFYFTIRFYPLRTSKIHWKKIQNKKIDLLKFDLEKCPGSNRFVPSSNWPKIAVESLKIYFFQMFNNYKVEHHKGYYFCRTTFSNSAYSNLSTM